MQRGAGRLAILMLVLTASGQAAITYSGEQNLSIPSTFGGLYLDFDDPNNAASFVVNPPGVSSASTVAVPWDFNFFFGGAGIASSDTSSPNTAGPGPLAAAINHPAGTVVSTGDTFPGGFSGSLGHMGAGPGQFTSSGGGGPGGTEGYLVILIDPSSFTSAPPASPLVGWMRVTLEDDGSAGVIHDWAWETEASNLEVGAIPEPGIWTLVLLAALAMTQRRRRT